MATKWAASDEENQWRRTFCQVPFNAIHEHAEKGKRSLQGLVAFFRRKAQTERGASEQLRKVLRDEIGALEEPGSGIRRTLLELQTYIDESCRQQQVIAQVLDEQVAEPLASLKDASESYIQTLQGEILNAHNEYQVAVDEHNETMDRLNKAARGLREARDKQRLALQGIGVPVFELQRLAARVAKWEEEQAQAVMARVRAKTTLYNRIIARDEMTMAVSVAYQKAEEERLDQLHKSLRRFLHVEKERLQVSQQMLTTLETHVQSLSRAEDIQLFIHNQRDPDNMHFQGKALALLDWQWNKAQGDRAVTVRRHPHSLLEHRSSIEANEVSLATSPRNLPATPLCPRQGHALNTTVMASGALLDSPHTDRPQHPMSTALCQCFADDVKHTASFREEDGDAIEEPLRKQSNADSDKLVIPREGESRHASVTAEALVRETCKTVEGRGLFVKCLNRQRSLETKIKDRASFDTLVTCFKAFLDECVREDDVKAAKTAMILAETFYYPKSRRQDGEVQLEASQQEAGELQRNGWIEDEGDDFKTSSLSAECGDFTKCTNEKLLQHVDETHPLLHGGGLGRGATRTYLQEEVKEHSIWQTPSFWEKALLLAIGEELQRTPQPCPWEELVSGVPKHDNLPSREEAVCRVHNIVFGQLGSFTLSMLEFEVPLSQIESFVETMCDAHELTEDQRFLLRRNLQEIFATLR